MPLYANEVKNYPKTGDANSDGYVLSWNQTSGAFQLISISGSVGSANKAGAQGATGVHKVEHREQPEQHKVPQVHRVEMHREQPEHKVPQVHRE